MLLWIKGSSADAECKAREYGIELQDVRRNVSALNTVEEVTALTSDANDKKVARWFCADLGRKAPPPNGSLLYYRHGPRNVAED